MLTYGRSPMGLATRSVALAGLVLTGAGDAAAKAKPAGAGELIGQVYSYEVRGDENLLDVARKYGLGYIEARMANPDVDPWLPGEGTMLILPTAFIVPDAPASGIIINLSEQRLYFFPPRGGPVQTFPIGIGRDGLESPLGRTKVARKKAGPSWRPTKRMRSEDPTLPAVVEPGPDNPLGTHAIYLGWPQYLVHGTNKPWGIGRRVSSGCIRLYPEDIVRLFPNVSVGMSVSVVDQPIKIGRWGGELFIEAHTSQHQADQAEISGEFQPEEIPDLVARVLDTAGEDADRIDWNVVHDAVYNRTGVPVQITKPEGAAIASSGATDVSELDLRPKAQRKRGDGGDLDDDGSDAYAVDPARAAIPLPASAPTERMALIEHDSHLRDPDTARTLAAKTPVESRTAREAPIKLSGGALGEPPAEVRERMEREQFGDEGNRRGGE